MGEALMPRRGGSVKRGQISTYGDRSYARYQSISDPNLVDVRNAIIFLNHAGGWGGSPNSPHAVTSVIIENGQAVDWTIFTSGGEAVKSTFLASSGVKDCSFTPSEGKITTRGNNGFLITDDEKSAYDYFIFD